MPTMALDKWWLGVYKLATKAEGSEKRMRGVEFFAAMGPGEEIEDMERLQREWEEALKKKDELAWPSTKSKEAVEAPDGGQGGDSR